MLAYCIRSHPSPPSLSDVSSRGAFGVSGTTPAAASVALGAVALSARSSTVIHTVPYHTIGEHMQGMQGGSHRRKAGMWYRVVDRVNVHDATRTGQHEPASASFSSSCVNAARRLMLPILWPRVMETGVRGGEPVVGCGVLGSFCAAAAICAACNNSSDCAALVLRRDDLATALANLFSPTSTNRNTPHANSTAFTTSYRQGTRRNVRLGSVLCGRLSTTSLEPVGTRIQLGSGVHNVKHGSGTSPIRRRWSKRWSKRCHGP